MNQKINIIDPQSILCRFGDNVAVCMHIVKELMLRERRVND